MSKHHSNFYVSRLHIFTTILVALVPLVVFGLVAHFSAISTSELLSQMGVSVTRLVLAYLIAVILAWAFATLFYRGRRANVMLPIDVLQSFPTFAILPTVTYIWGPRPSTVVFLLVITIIWPILFSITSSLKSIKQDWYDVAQISNLRGWNYLKSFLFPITIPGLITGSIIGLGEGWEALVGTEIIVGIQSGLGVYFQDHVQATLITAVGVFALMAVIFGINKLLWLPLLDWSHTRMEE